MCEKDCEKVVLDANFLAQQLVEQKQPAWVQRSVDHLLDVIRSQAYKLYKESGFRTQSSADLLYPLDPNKPFPKYPTLLSYDPLVGEIVYPTVIVATPTPFKPYKRRTRMFKKRALRKKHGPRPYRRPLW